MHWQFRSFIHPHTMIDVVKISAESKLSEGFKNPSFSIMFHPISSLSDGFMGMGSL
jgi:hypothetical protein